MDGFNVIIALSNQLNSFESGFLKIINDSKIFNPQYMVFVFDENIVEKNSSFHFNESLKRVLTWLNKMKIRFIFDKEYENTIFSIVSSFKEENITLLSNNQIFLQELDNCNIYDFIHEKYMQKEDLPVSFKNIRLYLTLKGNIFYNRKGIPLLTNKEIVKISEKYENINKLYENINKFDYQTKVLLSTEKERILKEDKSNELSKKYNLLNINIFDLPKYNPFIKISEELVKLGFRRQLEEGINNPPWKTKLPNDFKMPDVTQEEEVMKSNKKGEIKFIAKTILDEIELFDLINKIKEDTIFALDTETTHINPNIAKLVGMSFCFDSINTYYVPLKHNSSIEQISYETTKKFLKSVLTKTKNIIYQNYIYDVTVLENNLQLQMPVSADTMILSWLNEPDFKHGLDYLAKTHYDYKMKSFKELVSKGQTFADVEIEKASFYAGEDAFITRKLYFTLCNELKANSSKNLINYAKKVEYPFSKVLKTMEDTGIKVDRKQLEKLKKEYEIKINTLSSKIADLIGDVNINSPKQLSDKLYGDLGLTVSGKKTTIGYSTSEIALKQIIHEHEVIDLLLEYRKQHKFYATYIIPILKYSNNSENRVHTNYKQIGTVTGRLSSNNPNLQNIPKHDDSGILIRNCFIAKDGYKLVAIDYSQIELRLLAHFSESKKLIEAFKLGKDIHLETSKQIFGIKEAEEKRSIAKSINFGIIYGMGAKKLSEETGISKQDSKEYIKNYFDEFEDVKAYLENLKNDSKRRRCIVTLNKRKRKFDYSNKNIGQKLALEREAVNTKFQASASDIIKLAMNKIYEKYKNDTKCKMLLQIHDEIVFEISNDRVNYYVKDLVNIMENIVSLKVPLKVEAVISDKWGK